jgi:tRNA/tmRNA/rRNA uracil-C5-methylase (TrmA/RlmC/RlmD family)
MAMYRSILAAAFSSAAVTAAQADALLLDPPRSGCAACSTTHRICREVRVTHLAASGVIS